MKLGFIGVGTMGYPMVVNLRKAGFPVEVFVRKDEMRAKCEEIGCTVASSIPEMARRADAVLLCVTNDAAVQEIVAGEQGLLKGAHPGLIIIDHSTVSPFTSQSLQSAAGEQGVFYLDAPISGGPMGAAAATLTIMVGGDESAFERVHTVLSAMGKNIKRLGTSGAGNIAKLINQLIIGATQSAISEGFVLGTKMGVDPQSLYEVISTSTGNSAMLHRTVPDCILERNFDPKFTIALLLKDLRLANDIAREAGVRVLAGSIAEQVFSEAATFGLGDQDISALIVPLENMNNLTVSKTKS